MLETQKGIIKPVIYAGIINQDRLLLVKYKIPPNPRRTGMWWIPAPELEYGEDPKQKLLELLSEWGLKDSQQNLLDVESFVTPGGWHLLYHFNVTTKSQFVENSNIEESRWVTEAELFAMEDIAHGDWEKDLGKMFLEKAAD